MNIAIIPARGGSKRIPRKNLRDFCGRPAISYSIQAALDAGVFDKVIVSTDDKEIAEVARQYGAETPFIRPAELSDDHTPTVPVVRHAVEWVVENDGEVDKACCIYATAPFVTTQALRETCQLLEQGDDLDFVFPVTSFPFPIFRAVELSKESRVSMIWPEYELTRSQDLTEAYHDAGQFYWGRANSWREREAVYSSNTKAYQLPRHLVQDLDTEEDWERAELMFQALGKPSF